MQNDDVTLWNSIGIIVIFVMFWPRKMSMDTNTKSKRKRAFVLSGVIMLAVFNAFCLFNFEIWGPTVSENGRVIKITYNDFFRQHRIPRLKYNLRSFVNCRFSILYIPYSICFSFPFIHFPFVILLICYSC